MEFVFPFFFHSHMYTRYSRFERAKRSRKKRIEALLPGEIQGTQKKKKKKKRKKSIHDRIASFSRLEGTGRNKKVTEKGVGDKGDVGRRDVRQAAPVGPPRASASLVFHLPFLTLVSQSLPLPLPLSLSLLHRFRRENLPPPPCFTSLVHFPFVSLG